MHSRFRSVQFKSSSTLQSHGPRVISFRAEAGHLFDSSLDGPCRNCTWMPKGGGKLESVCQHFTTNCSNCRCVGLDKIQALQIDCSSQGFRMLLVERRMRVQAAKEPTSRSAAARSTPCNKQGSACAISGNQGKFVHGLQRTCKATSCIYLIAVIGRRWSPTLEVGIQTPKPCQDPLSPEATEVWHLQEACCGQGPRFCGATWLCTFRVCIASIASIGDS